MFEIWKAFMELWNESAQRNNVKVRPTQPPQGLKLCITTSIPQATSLMSTGAIQYDLEQNAD